MKIIIGLLVMFLFLGGPAFGEIEIKYDRFKDRTIIQTTPKTAIRGTAKQPALNLIGHYSGQTPSRPEECYFGFFVKSPSWAYLRCNSVSCLVDGIPVVLPPSKHRGDTGRGYVLEHIFIMVPFDTIEQLSKCEKVEFKICN